MIFKSKNNTNFFICKYIKYLMLAIIIMVINYIDLI